MPFSVTAVARLFFLLWLFAVPAFADDLVTIPPLQSRVTDLTNTLFKDQATALEASLTELQRTKGSQVVILILPTDAAGEHRAVWHSPCRGVEDRPHGCA